MFSTHLCALETHLKAIGWVDKAQAIFFFHLEAQKRVAPLPYFCDQPMFFSFKVHAFPLLENLPEKPIKYFCLLKDEAQLCSVIKSEFGALLLTSA